MTISICIVTLDAGKLLKKCIDSIPAAIGNLSYEIIVVDNNSSDNTEFVAKEHGARVVKESRKGYGSACLKGMDELDSPDIVIVEGFKNEPHQKIEIIKEGSNNYLFTKLENIIGIVSDKKIDTLIPQFKREDIESIAEHILNQHKR